LVVPIERKVASDAEISDWEGDFSIDAMERCAAVYESRAK
jgi:hypothetical protein